MTLEDFLESPQRNSWIRYKDLEVYVRKSVRLIEGVRINALDIGNMKNKKRSDNSYTHFTRTGLYREFDNLGSC